MSLIQARKPILSSNILGMNYEYFLLLRRRKHLLEELDDDASSSKSLRSLRRVELAHIDHSLFKIDNFLNRYGLINRDRRT
jgi:hypothetical protein